MSASFRSLRLTLSRSLIALVFCGMGVLHFVKPEPFLKVMPAVFPYPYALVLISGCFEFLGGAGVLIPLVRRAAGFGLIALLIVVFPVNISMFLRHVQTHAWDVNGMVLLLRLPLQFVMIWWVHNSTRPAPSQSARSAFDGESSAGQGDEK